MVTDQYAKIIDTNRKKTATLFEESFFNDEKDTTKEINDDTLKELASLVSTNPEMLQKFMSYIVK